MTPASALSLGLITLGVANNGFGGEPDLQSTEAACAALQAFIAKEAHLPVSGPSTDGWSGWFCDSSTLDVEGYYVIALRSNRPAPYSNLMGWYAVDRQTHAVLSWDLVEQKVIPLNQGK